MFGWRAPASTSALLAADIYAPMPMIVMLICAALVWQPVQAHDWAQHRQGWPRLVFLTPLFAIAIMVMFSQAFNPFLYFQF